MRRKTSVSLTEELLDEIGRVGAPGVNRSEFLETAGWDRIALLRRRNASRIPELDRALAVALELL